MVIGIRGELKVGKDAVTNIILKRLSESGVVATNRKFADKLKDIICLLINCTREELEDRDFKTRSLGPEWTAYRIVGDYEYTTGEYLYTSLDEAQKQIDTNWKGYDKSVFIREELLTPRKLLQLIGTEGGRDLIHPNMWCNALFSEYDVTSNWVVSDVRFPNEVAIIESNGGVVINIVRPFELRFPQYAYLKEDTTTYQQILDKLKKVDVELFTTLSHQSETILNDFSFEYTVHNDSTLTNLVENVTDIIDKCWYK